MRLDSAMVDAAAAAGNGPVAAFGPEQAMVANALARTGLTDAAYAQHLQLSPEAIRLWRSGRRPISIGHVRTLERDFGIPRHELRPDLYDPPEAAPERAA